MNFSFSESDGVRHVVMTGRITYSTLDLQQDPLVQYDSNIYSRRVYFDLSGIDYIDSSGVSWLLSCNRRFREAGGKLVLHSLHPLVSQVLRMLKLEKVLHLAESARHAGEEVAV